MTKFEYMVAVDNEPAWYKKSPDQPNGTDFMIFEIFSPKKSAKKIGVFVSKQSQIMTNFNHNIGFWEKRLFFRRK
jgi:hypothetical protein